MAPRVAAPTPETAMEVLMAACAPAAEMDFQLVEMVDKRLSTASLHRFRFSWPSFELEEERSLAGWDDGDLEGMGAGSVSPSWQKCCGVCSAIECNGRPEVDAWKGGPGEMR